MLKTFNDSELFNESNKYKKIYIKSKHYSEAALKKRFLDYLTIKS